MTTISSKILVETDTMMIRKCLILHVFHLLGADMNPSEAITMRMPTILTNRMAATMRAINKATRTDTTTINTMNKEPTSKTTIKAQDDAEAKTPKRTRKPSVILQ